MSPPALFSLRSHRLRVGLLLMLGMYVSVSMRLNLSMGVTCMVNSTAYSVPYSVNESLILLPESSCQRNMDVVQDKSSGYTGSLLWSPSMQALLFSATFYGGLITIAISGYIADKFGPKVILILTVTDYIIMTMLAPFLATNSYWAYFGSRVIMGLGEGFVFPCMNSIASKWFPPTEKSTMAAIYTSGNQLAAGFSALIASGLCTSPLGWPSIFYAFGSAGIVWCIVWFIFVTNTPAKNKWISEEEKTYLEDALSNQSARNHFKENAIPWKSLLVGNVVQSIFWCQFTYNFSASILQGFLPTYFKEVLFLPIHLNGIFTMVPFLSQLASKNILGLLSDHLKRKKVMTNTRSAVLFQSIGSFGSAASLAALAIFPSCNFPYIALPILTAYGTFFSAGICGFFTSLISIAPPYTGTITSISMTYATVANFSGPLMLSFIDYMGWPNKWMITFLFAAFINVLSGLFFLFNGSAEIQSWAKSPLPDKGSPIPEKVEEKGE